MIKQKQKEERLPQCMDTAISSRTKSMEHSLTMWHRLIWRFTFHWTYSCGLLRTEKYVTNQKQWHSFPNIMQTKIVTVSFSAISCPFELPQNFSEWFIYSKAGHNPDSELHVFLLIAHKGLEAQLLLVKRMAPLAQVIETHPLTTRGLH